jgi:23S rRNA pseudouridine1911/1915/1917 synthase
LDSHVPNRKLSILVSHEDVDQRIDTYLASSVREITRSRIQGLVKEGLVSVNRKPVKASYRLRPGDQIELQIPPARIYRLQPEPVEISSIYEDPSLIVLNKPPGLVVHPAPGHVKGTLVHGLLHHSKDLSGIGGFLRPGIVHRLDKDTSGVMVVAKNDRAHISLARQFKSGEVRKRYMSIIHGSFPSEEGKIDLPIGRHPKKRKEMAIQKDRGRRAVTFWERVEDFGEEFSLLALTPRTGRTHQIRVHLSHAGHPILGDCLYGHGRNWRKRRFPPGEKENVQVRRQMLHAEKLGFKHPETGQYCEFEAALPGDMVSVIKMLRRLS